MKKVTIKIKKIKGCEDLPFPSYMTPSSSGMDLFAAVSEEVIIKPGEIKLIPCGFILELPEGYEAQIRPRSGLALKYGITVLNSPGTIDADYRGEVKVILINHGKYDFTVKRGDRIAQMVLSEVIKAEFIEADVLDITERGKGGFGHTGI
ncbi:dUTP diphosphatase [Thermovenabulum sp.]|uniref:dUTP diphosphatase n=1 Tax=Thermovenabulum sp. TaxID=3100335 RepID=UPI003C7D6335